MFFASTVKLRFRTYEVLHARRRYVKCSMLHCMLSGTSCVNVITWSKWTEKVEISLFGLWRSGLLACLSRDSSEIKLYDVQQSTTESSGLTLCCHHCHMLVLCCISLTSFPSCKYFSYRSVLEVLRYVASFEHDYPYLCFYLSGTGTPG